MLLRLEAASHFFMPPAAPVSSFLPHGTHLSKDHPPVSIKECDAREALAVFEGVAHEMLRCLEAASHFFICHQQLRCPLFFRTTQLSRASSFQFEARGKALPVLERAAHKRLLRLHSAISLGLRESVDRPTSCHQSPPFLRTTQLSRARPIRFHQGMRRERGPRSS